MFVRGLRDLSYLFVMMAPWPRAPGQTGEEEVHGDDESVGPALDTLESEVEQLREAVTELTAVLLQRDPEPPCGSPPRPPRET